MSREEPQEIKTSAMLWLIAVAAGVFETGLTVLDAMSVGPGLSGAMLGGVLFRLAIFGTVGALLADLRLGRHRSRMTLALLAGGAGTLSLVIGPAQWLAAGHSPMEAVRAIDLISTLVAGSQVANLSAAIGATVLMFRPAANAYFRPLHSGLSMMVRRPYLDQVDAVWLPHAAAPDQQLAGQQMAIAGEEHPVDRAPSLLQPWPRRRAGHDDHVARGHADHELAGHRRGKVRPELVREHQRRRQPVEAQHQRGWLAVYPGVR
jgi:hypothetical protein